MNVDRDDWHRDHVELLYDRGGLDVSYASDVSDESDVNDVNGASDANALDLVLDDVDAVQQIAHLQAECVLTIEGSNLS